MWLGSINSTYKRLGLIKWKAFMCLETWVSVMNCRAIYLIVVEIFQLNQRDGLMHRLSLPVLKKIKSFTYMLHSKKRAPLVENWLCLVSSSGGAGRPAFIILVFLRTWQSCSRCEGHKESHILIKDQRAKNNTPPAGAAPRDSARCEKTLVHVLIITHTQQGCYYA